MVAIRQATTIAIENPAVIRHELVRFARAARGRRMRSRVQFAQDCIVIPEGPFADEHWRPHFQPYTYHILNLMDTAGYRKFRITGCVQSGKTFLVVIVVCWHLFERHETVIYGVPDLHETGADKWREELLPVIQKSPYMSQFIPDTGRGSRGGTPTAIKFTNGATLRFMSATGGDHRRSHYTAPVVVKTEVDRYDEAGEKSRETTPVEQMEGRTEAFGDRAFSYEECTVTTEQGRIWSELERSTGTKLHVPCVGCGHYVCPTRDDFVGYEEAVDVEEAAELGAFKCPYCGVLWSNTERLSMVTVDKILPLHRGQSVKNDAGLVSTIGLEPKTDCLGVSWNAFHNRFWSTRKIAVDEWNALYSKHPDEADLKRRQFAWALPAEPEEFELLPLSIAILSKRVRDLPSRVVPPNTRWMSCGVDVRKIQLHYVVRAWTDRDGVVEGHAVDIGVMPVDSEKLGVRLGLLEALKSFREDRILVGYHDQEGKLYRPGWTLIDAGWQEEIIWEFIYDCACRGIPGFMPILGRGQSEPPGTGSYNHPQNLSQKIPWIGEQCYVRKSSKYEHEFAIVGNPNAAMFVFANSDEWKSFMRYGYTTPPGRPGALTTFKETTADERKMLREYRRQITVESMYRKLVPRRGVVDVWRNDGRKPNHLADADYYACVAANLCDVPIVVRSRLQKPIESPVREPMRMPDGRAFMEVA